MLVVLEFDRDFSLIAADPFVRACWCEASTPAAVIGRTSRSVSAQGAMALLAVLGEPLARRGGRRHSGLDGRPISSTSIRESLGRGMGVAPAALGAGSSTARWSTGAAVGPTSAPRRRTCRPCHASCFLGEVSTPAPPNVGGRRSRAAINVGTNPTFGVDPLHVEAFLLEFQGELHGDPLSISSGSAYATRAVDRWKRWSSASLRRRTGPRVGPDRGADVAPPIRQRSHPCW